MAPQESIPVAANVLGTIGTIFWCIQLIPQIWTNYKTKNTEGLPGSMMFLWALAAVPFGMYAIVQNLNIPIQCQAQIFCALSLICWGQILYYGRKWPLWKAIALPGGCAAVFAGLEAGGIVGIRIPYSRGVSWPITVVGILAAVLLAAGLLPPYYEIYQRKGQVVGINMLFLLIDALGAFFSLMSLVAQHEFDVLGGVQYTVCLGLEVGIFGFWFVDLGKGWLARRRGEVEEVVKEVDETGRSETDSETEQDAVDGSSPRKIVEDEVETEVRGDDNKV